MPYQRYMADTSHTDGIGELEFAVTHIGPACPYDIRKVIGYMEMFTVIHAHTHEQLGLGIDLSRTFKIVIFE